MAYEKIHENDLLHSLFSNIINVGLNVTDKVFNILPGANRPMSITKGTKDFVLTFPVYVSDNMTGDTMSLLCKSLERKYASLLAILFNSVTCVCERDVRRFIKRFHINSGSELVSLRDSHEFFTTPREVAEYNTRVKSILEDMKNINHVLPYSVSESDLTGKNDKLTSINEAGKDDVGAEARLENNEIKKATEMQPSILSVKYTGEVNGNVVNKTFMVGVKCVPYKISSATLISKLAKADINKGILNLVRATTREISFVKDFLFTIDTIKKEAMASASNKESMREWKKLEQRSLLVKLNKLTGINLAQAITTVCITQADADIMKQEYNVDILNPNIMKSAIRKYSLLGMVVADEEFEVLHMMFDGDSDISEIPKKMLKKSSPEDKLIKILSKNTL